MSKSPPAQKNRSPETLEAVRYFEQRDSFERGNANSCQMETFEIIEVDPHSSAHPNWPIIKAKKDGKLYEFGAIELYMELRK